MATKENIIVGAASLYVGPSKNVPLDGTFATMPDDSVALRTALETDYAAALGAGWRDVGYTQEGVELSYEPDFGDVEVDQELDSARIFKQSMRVTVNTTLAEATLENLLLAWGRPVADLGSGDDGETPIQGGRLGEAPNEYGLFIVGNAPEGVADDDTVAPAGGTPGLYGARVYRVYRAISVETTAHAMRRNEPTVFAVSFRCLPVPGGNYGSVRDVPTPDVTPDTP